VAVGVRQRDSVLNRFFRDALQSQIDRQLQAAGRACDADDPGRTDRSALGVDDDSGLVEPAIQQPVVGRFGARLADDRACAKAWIRVGGELRRADLTSRPRNSPPIEPLG